MHVSERRVDRRAARDRGGSAPDRRGRGCDRLLLARGPLVEDVTVAGVVPVVGGQRARGLREEGKVILRLRAGKQVEPRTFVARAAKRGVTNGFLRQQRVRGRSSSLGNV